MLPLRKASSSEIESLIEDVSTWSDGLLPLGRLFHARGMEVYIELTYQNKLMQAHQLHTLYISLYHMCA